MPEFIRNNEREAPNSKNHLKSVGAILALSGAGVMLAGCSDAKIDYGKPNPNATSITIEDGANLRTEPYIGSIDQVTLLHEVKLDKITTDVVIPTPHGVYERNDSDNGEWFGISASDLPKTFTDTKKDSDGIIWVNSQRAKENVVDNKATTQAKTNS